MSKWGDKANADRVRDQLRRQLGFLHRSCVQFDQGFRDEAIRIATGIRVLLSDREKGKQKTGQGSILHHLGAKHIALRTTCSVAQAEGLLIFDGYLHLPFNMRPWDEYLRRPVVELPVKAWWHQIIFATRAGAITRRDIVLGAADKDGGAHVDLQLSEGYAAVMAMWTVHGRDAEGAPTEEPLSENHLYALRRFGLELLNSPQLLALADMSPEEMGETGGGPSPNAPSEG